MMHTKTKDLGIKKGGHTGPTGPGPGSTEIV